MLGKEWKFQKDWLLGMNAWRSNLNSIPIENLDRNIHSIGNKPGYRDPNHIFKSRFKWEKGAIKFPMIPRDNGNFCFSLRSVPGINIITTSKRREIRQNSEIFSGLVISCSVCRSHTVRITEIWDLIWGVQSGFQPFKIMGSWSRISNLRFEQLEVKI
jgi:hypothetical protein